MNIVTRFAPSPTGRLHLGHAMSAIRAHDFARARGGRFVLRIEDIDGTRSRPEFVAGIREDLAWLGLRWDALTIQSERFALYETALAHLRVRGLLYPCFCTRAEIAASASAPHGDASPAYPGTCRALSSADIASRKGACCWRLDMARAVAETGPLTWYDTQAGVVVADPMPQGDIVLARKDAPASYHLAATFDDATQGITDIIRGVDLFDATHVHRVLYALFEWPVPTYHHHPLLVGSNGQRLAKRDGAPSLAAMREAGADGAALAGSLRAGCLMESGTDALP